MTACRLFSLARKSAPFSLQKLAPFSASAAATLRSSNYSTDEEEEEVCSNVYRDKIKFQRPPTIRTRPRFNSGSFIGSVRLPPRIITSRTDEYGVVASLEVQNSPESEPTLRISLCMWNKMADTFLKHFTCNDFIYVSGRLGRYTYDLLNGGQTAKHQVLVKELNFVAPRHRGTICHKLEESQPQKGEVGLDEYKTGHHLWNVFFSNPSEWKDNRETKGSSMSPDFFHIDTGKALWQWPNDPPWIKERLELLDRQMGKQSRSESDLEKHEYYLKLWEEFFTNPYEWYDAREMKKNLRHPDFVHKYTGEALWLNPSVGKRLESLDLNMANQGRGEVSLEKYKDFLHLWQVFFANPGEWWDNRERKKNPIAPDFVHKDTREALWLNPNDPPWIKKQLDSLDAQRAEQGLGEGTGRQSLWDYYV